MSARRKQVLESEDRPVETVPITALRPHPRNYRGHPADQIEHLAASLEEHGFYRNVVIAEDGTILAGHGVIEAAQHLGRETVRVVRLPIAADSPAALKVLTGDNEIEHLAEQDDRLLSELLREIAADDPLDLLGTGYDAAMLANLVFVTRPASEIADHDEAAHWAGMPEFEPNPEVEARCQLVVRFRSESDRQQFCVSAGLPTSTAPTQSLWWPAREQEDTASIALVEVGS